ncbi:DUF1127 domain-containing protein [Neoaquamicrobium sediminum]|uniref:DUF1127 domain-containing protein n=1 Tax=Neoaquamicrobium sediminum TaxID=1849104 RepID=UPI00156391BB|nr:DUF1127 domain-containing protein [Mesorhizobium sediminum]NRC56671.1 DUF1127 domain-containing protein [Mesorhizobium sediminum]
MHTEIINSDIPLSPKPHGAGQRNRGRRHGMLGRWARNIVRNWQRHRMIAALRAMDDNLLHNIGISRNDIPRIVDGFDDRELRMRPVAPELEHQSALGSPVVS